jgi:hypothetical protein
MKRFKTKHVFVRPRHCTRKFKEIWSRGQLLAIIYIYYRLLYVIIMIITIVIHKHIGRMPKPYFWIWRGDSVTSPCLNVCHTGPLSPTRRDFQPVDPSLRRPSFPSPVSSQVALCRRLSAVCRRWLVTTRCPVAVNTAILFGFFSPEPVAFAPCFAWNLTICKLTT